MGFGIAVAVEAVFHKVIKILHLKNKSQAVTNNDCQVLNLILVEA